MPNATPPPPTPPDPQKKGQSAPPIPEMVGATSASFSLTEKPTQLSVPILPPTGPALLQANRLSRRVSLTIENITSKQESPSYEVYLNLPAGADPLKHPEFRIGNLAMFGLLESSRPSDTHAENGLTYTFDVTALYFRLSASKEWDSKNVRLTFVPESWPVPANVKVGRASLYFQ